MYTLKTPGFTEINQLFYGNNVIQCFCWVFTYKMRRFSPRRLVLAVLIAISALWLLYLCASFMFNRQKSILRYQIEQELQKYVSLSDTIDCRGGGERDRKRDHVSHIYVNKRDSHSLSCWSLARSRRGQDSQRSEGCHISFLSLD